LIAAIVSMSGTVEAEPSDAWRLLVSENFESYGEGASLAKPWTAQTKPGSLCRITRQTASPFERGVRCLHLENPTPAGHLANAQLVFGPVCRGRVKLQFDFRVDDPKGNWGAMLYRLDKEKGWGVATTLKCGLPDGEFAGYIANTAISYRRTPIQPAAAKKWYRVTIVTKAPFDTCDVTVQRADGSPQTMRHLGGRSGRGQPGWIDRLMLGAGWYGSRGPMFVDNVRLWAEQPDPRLRGPLLVADKAQAPEVTAHWAETPPAIDGRLDDACWWGRVTLDAANGWRTDRRAPLWTKAGVCYDAQHLYLAVRCRESQMDKLVAALGPDKTDHNTWPENDVELFIQPDLSRPLYGQFMVGAGGARGDLTPGRGMAWNTRWTAAVARYADDWTVECAIRLADILPDDGYVGTPAAGEEWGINFNRHHVVPEWISGWSPTVIGFQDPVNFGRVVFGEPTGHEPRLVRYSTGPQFYGANSAIELVWANPGEQAIRLTGKLQQADAPRISEVTVPAKGQAALRLPYVFDRAGVHSFTIEVRDGDAVVYEASARVNLPDLHPVIAKWTRRSRWAAEVAARLPDDRARADQQRVARALGERASSLAERLRNTCGLVPSACRQLTQDILALDRDRGLAQQIDFLRVCEADLDADGRMTEAGYVVGTGTPLDWVFPTSVPPQLPGRAELSAARGECESFQVVVFSPWRDLANVAVELPELRHADGDALLGPDRIEHEVAGYLVVPQAAKDPGDPVAWPDLLLPLEGDHAPRGPIGISKGQNQAFWATVHVPAEAKPGVYRGEVRVTAKGRPSVTVPVELMVWDFDLPKRPSLATDCWLSMDHPYKSKRPYRIAADTVTVEQYKLLSRFITSYRISSTPYGNLMCTLPKLVRGRDGELKVDWTRFDRLMEIAFADGSTNFNPNFSCNSGFFSYFGQYSNLGLPITIRDEATGREEVIWDGKRTDAPQESLRERNLRDDSLYIRFMTLYVQHLKEKGWLKYARLENWDEPGGHTLSILRRHHAFLKKHVPELKLTAFRAIPSIGLDERHIDVWAPLLVQVPAEREAIRRHVREYGHEFWTYVCGGQRRSGTGRTPDVLVSGAPIERRIIPWMCWKWEITGYLMFALNAWHGRFEYTWSPQPHLCLHVPRNFRADVGNLLYPYPLPEHCPQLQTFAGSIRLVNARDGIEDYEYLAICRDLTNRLKSARNPSIKERRLIEQSDDLLTVSDILISSPYEWDDDAEPYLRRRRELARHIIALRRQLR